MIAISHAYMCVYVSMYDDYTYPWQWLYHIYLCVYVCIFLCLYVRASTIFARGVLTLHTREAQGYKHILTCMYVYMHIHIQEEA